MPISKTTASSVRAPKPKQDPAQLFADAVAQKRRGELGKAVATLEKVIALDPARVSAKIALAGYQAIAGDAAKARATFASIEAPGPLPAGVAVSPQGFDHHMNAAWFHAVLGEDDKVIAHVQGAFTQAPAEAARKVLADFFATEPDLQRLKAHPVITALLAPPTPSPAASPTQAAPNAFEAAAAADFAKGQAAPAATGGANALATRVQNATRKTPTKAAKPRASTVALQQLGALVPSAAAVTKGAGAGLATLLKDGIQKALDSGARTARFEPSQLDRHMAPAFSDPSNGYDDVVQALQKLGYEAGADGFTGIRVSLDVAAPRGDTSAAGKQAFLAELATTLPAPPSPGAADVADAGKQLAVFVTKEIKAAVRRGETRVVLETSPLDRAMTPGFPDPYKHYGAVAKKLKELGYETGSDGFIGVRIAWQSQHAPPTKAAMLAAVSAEVPPASARPTSAQALGSLVQQKVDEAMAKGKQRTGLETGELDRTVGEHFEGGMASYQPIAQELEKLGFQTTYDGFVGIGLSWG